jgi:two-component system, cell cycle response regulator
MHKADGKTDELPEAKMGSVRPVAPMVLPVRDHYLLRMIRGPEAGATWSLYDGEAIIGRGYQASIRIEDEALSLQHARVIVGAAGVTLRDLGTPNGTYVEGKQLKGPIVLRNADRVCLGSTCLRLDAFDPYEREVDRRMRETAVRDRLTNLFNRNAFEERLSAEVAFARRHGTTIGVVMIDIDFFKQVNDTYGHSAGDAVLRSVAQGLQNTVRAEDITGRYGGEELSVIARGIDRAGLAQFAERIRRTVEAGSVPTGDAVIKVTASCGVAGVTGANARKVTSTSLVHEADMALYEAKRQGRNRVVISDAFGIY